MRRVKVKKLLFILLITLACAIFLFLTKEFIANYMVKMNMGKIDIPQKNSRVLIFAPHNDDETLGAGAFIKMALKNGCIVKLVMVTNGDGFSDAVKIEDLKANPKPSDYIEFGYARQKETIAAMKVFGLSEKDIVFLGYPDGGVSHLWSSNWDKSNPFTSKFTAVDKTPYTNSYTKGALYSGSSIVDDITKIIEDYKPTHIIYPHPNDRHPDHWATNALVKYVLTKINYTPEKQWLYLVHRGDWPTPMKRDATMYLVPPAKLANTGTQWYAADMGAEEIKVKTTAIHLYKTQIKLLRLLMTAFERKNEMFGEYNNLLLISNVRDDSKISKDAQNKIINDPLQDAINLEVGKSADISGMYAEDSKENNLHFFIELDSKVEETPSYHLNLLFINDNNTRHLNLILHNKKLTAVKIADDSIVDIKNINFKINGKIIEFIVPESSIGNYKHIFVNASTMLGSEGLDKTAWRMLDK
jgi:LmbE family N-acetylglucosaminyl deacetylase